MLCILVKSAVVIGSCSSIAILSTLWVRPIGKEIDEKINFKKQRKTINEIKRVQDIDVWGKENGCAFIFVKDFEQKKIYSSLEYIEKNGTNDSVERKRIENAMVEAANKFKGYCDYKLKTFTLLWNKWARKFDIGNPDDQTQREWSDLQKLINNFSPKKR